MLLCSISFCLLLSSCTSEPDPVEQAKEEMQVEYSKCQEILLSIIYQIHPLLSVDNQYFWYPKGTTKQEALNDEFTTGIRGLNKLSKLLAQLNIGDNSVQDRVRNLQKEIEEQIKEMKDIRQASFFGLFSGIISMLDVSNELDEEMEIPGKIGANVEELKSYLLENWKDLVEDMMRNIHEKAINNKELTPEQYNEITNCLVDMVIESFNEKVQEKEIVCYIDYIVSGFNKRAKFIYDNHVEYQAAKKKLKKLGVYSNSEMYVHYKIEKNRSYQQDSFIRTVPNSYFSSKGYFIYNDCFFLDNKWDVYSYKKKDNQITLSYETTFMYDRDKLVTTTTESRSGFHNKTFEMSDSILKGSYTYSKETTPQKEIFVDITGDYRNNDFLLEIAKKTELLEYIRK